MALQQFLCISTGTVTRAPATDTLNIAGLDGATMAITTNASNAPIVLTPNGTGVIELAKNMTLSGATPSITATAADTGIAFVATGTGNLALTLGAGGSLLLGGAAAGAKVAFFGGTARIQSAAPATPSLGAGDLPGALTAITSWMNAITGALNTTAGVGLLSG